MTSTFVVAITELASADEGEVQLIADEVQRSAYDVRLRLAAGLPAVVLTTTEPAQAGAVLGSLRARGHGALTCDLASVVPSTAMVALRHFVLEEAGLRADRRADARLPYERILAMVHATHPESHRVTYQDIVYLGPREGVARQERDRVEHRSTQSLYLFRTDGETPWILREGEAHYEGLGAAAGPTQHQNFLAAVRALRDRAPGASFDDRLTAHPRSPEHFSRSFVHPDGGASPWADHGADLNAHLLALWCAERQNRAAV